jgi:ABC-type antimicrobial peptide transport system permease subunit
MTLDTMLDRSVATWRFGAWLVGTFAGIAVLLAALGLMTTMGWWVRQRTRELGVRVALGASRGGIVRLVGTQGLVLAATGVALGAGTAAGVTRYLASWLYGVTPLDAPTFAFGAMAMLVVASIAILVPVQRATRVDPVVALRTE